MTVKGDNPVWQRTEKVTGVRPLITYILNEVRNDWKILKPRISVIENTILKDICGSELIDLIAEMFLTGIIDMKGKII